MRYLLFVIVLLSIGCQTEEEKQKSIANGSDPFESLAATVKSDKYGTAFWSNEIKKTSPLWVKALSYCADNKDMPNCKSVNLVKWAGKPKPMPEYDSSRGIGSANMPY